MQTDRECRALEPDASLLRSTRRLTPRRRYPVSLNSQNSFGDLSMIRNRPPYCRSFLRSSLLTGGIFCVLLGGLWVLFLRDWQVDWAEAAASCVTGLGLIILQLMRSYSYERSLRAVESNGYRACTFCCYAVGDPEASVCPECGNPYSRDEAEALWSHALRRRYRNADE